MNIFSILYRCVPGIISVAALVIYVPLSGTQEISDIQYDINEQRAVVTEQPDEHHDDTARESSVMTAPPAPTGLKTVAGDGQSGIFPQIPEKMAKNRVFGMKYPTQSGIFPQIPEKMAKNRVFDVYYIYDERKISNAGECGYPQLSNSGSTFTYKKHRRHCGV